MNLSRKLDYVGQYIQNIVQHTDVDAAVRKAALDHVAKLVADGKDAVDAQVAAEIAAFENHEDGEE
jgi:uncharacterized protein (UPF0147 family)